MRLVLDTNEYLFAFGLLKMPACEELLPGIVRRFPHHAIRIPEKIVQEVRRNLTREGFREFLGFLPTHHRTHSAIRNQWALAQTWLYKLNRVNPAHSTL